MYVACLMAGESSRLLPLTTVDHKALLRVGNLRVIDIQMKIFALAGLNTFSFVVGHGGSRIANHLLTNYPRLALSIINNNHYALRNLDWSAYLALSSRPGDVIYYEGDIIASPGIIRQVGMHTGDVCVAMDPTGQSARVDTRVIGDEGRAYQLVFSEHGDLAKASGSSSEGEFLCLAKLSNRAREYVVGRLEKESYDGPMRLYQIFNDLFRHYPSFLVSTAGRPWVEIDNKADLLRARDIVNQIFSLQPSEDIHITHD
jgi:choline kinase